MADVWFNNLVRLFKSDSVKLVCDNAPQYFVYERINETVFDAFSPKNVAVTVNVESGVMLALRAGF